MKAELHEYNGCFSIDLTPETKEDALQLIRFGMNSTKELRSKSVHVNPNLSVAGFVVIGKTKNSTTIVGGR